MHDSYPFPIFSGLLEPKHYERIGTAVWLFIWCISSTTKEQEGDGTTWGLVLGSKPMKLVELAEPFGVDTKTVSRWLKTLEHHEYIRVTRAPYGLIIAVKNSRKYHGKRVDKNVRSVTADQVTDKTKMSDLSTADKTEMSELPDKNVRSNKDIIKDINTSSAASSVELNQNEIIEQSIEIEKHFCQRRGKGFNISPSDFDAVKRMIADGIPVDLIKQCVDESFATYKPKHARDEIRTITYCIPRCYDQWTKMQTISVANPIKSNFDSTKNSVSIGPAVPNVQATQTMIDDLELAKKRKQEFLRERMDKQARKSKQQMLNEQLLREIREAEGYHDSEGAQTIIFNNQ